MVLGALFRQNSEYIEEPWEIFWFIILHMKKTKVWTAQSFKIVILKITLLWASGVAQVAEHLPCKREALSSTNSIAKKTLNQTKKKKTKKKSPKSPFSQPILFF
jgi:hypothetical protein